MSIFSSRIFNYPKQVESVNFQDLNDLTYRQKLSDLCHGNTDILQKFDLFVESIKAYCLTIDLTFPYSSVLDALVFAAEKHQNQTRKDAAATPYIIHPMGVASSLWEEGGVRNPSVIIAALLHDTLEDTN